MNICGPQRYDKENNTCFNVDQLVEMAKAYNRYLSKTKLNPSRNYHFGDADLINIKSDKKYLLKQFKDRFGKICGSDEICLTHQAFMGELVGEMKDDILFGTFRSEGPSKSTEWLSTIDINQIMVPYENIYPNFKFIGAVPADCDQVSVCPLYNINYDKLMDEGINYIATIFNHDRYGQPGSHWVAMFVDINNGKLYYCDSNGKEPTKYIENSIEKFAQFYKRKTGNDIIYKYNKNSYQKDGSECGVYSCNFIIRMLSGEPFDNIVSNSLSFQEINSCRNVYFRNQPSKFKPHKLCDPTNSGK
ncbi:putative thiol protease [Acanthamoeba castellanii mimivirus]|uniref:Putative thiol protease R355 n=5 Tax=Mimivirus TaxID=315393 RepID=YR355_MIMIV|nr:putative thiol protease [Acanthamoeba polyphaga mimivirus]Q5UQV0.1 RecName: Full=Putative thiol protease R355 [Acanthamoeba polyphaga mimivirus]AHA45509.1 putative thiol protease [Hirudovirus strain Sangsue]ALR83935.1 putative thiol protease [Niemeyer virus]AMZ02800.1 putative thiol protease [Mimivirus Bombay]QTF49268.1 putative thiol protease [Mimivirus reunion]WMV61711.1 putative thiol protease [Mimivirus sp.]BAV61456.1 putative thiol protease [Acanthamoeba castellanii mimivirus]